MSLLDFVLLAAAGAFSGALNAVAGGGTFFTFAALMAAGLPPITANASSAVALTVGSVASATAYRREIGRFWRSALWLVLASGTGAFLGALILLALSNASFRALVPYIMLFATCVFAIGPRLARFAGSEAAGLLTLTENTDYHRINAIKQILAIAIQGVAILVFIRGGIIDWPAALTVMAAATVGGYLGVGLARRVPSKVMRFVVVAAGAALTIYYFVTG
jgi:uncharacterized membrane protein YfcA